MVAEGAARVRLALTRVRWRSHERLADPLPRAPPRRELRAEVECLGKAWDDRPRVAPRPTVGFVGAACLVAGIGRAATAVDVSRLAWLEGTWSERRR